MVIVTKELRGNETEKLLKEIVVEEGEGEGLYIYIYMSSD